MVNLFQRVKQEYSQRGCGWRVLPVHWMQPDGGCSCRAGLDCRSPAKHPLLRDWEQKSSDHPEFLEEWGQRRYPNANIGLAVGVSKLVVVDVDGAEGLQSLKTLQFEYEPLPKTLTHRTGGGGFHFLFRDERRSIAPTRGQLREGLDTRGDGGMIVAPPSRHQSGRSYGVLPGPKERRIGYASSFGEPPLQAQTWRQANSETSLHSDGLS